MWVLACQIQEFRILRKNIEQAWSMFLFVCFFFCPFISFLFLIPPTSLQNLTRLLSCRNKFGNNNSLECGIANGMSIQIHQSVLWILCLTASLSKIWMCCEISLCTVALQSWKSITSQVVQELFKLSYRYFITCSIWAAGKIMVCHFFMGLWYFIVTFNRRLSNSNCIISC